MLLEDYDPISNDGFKRKKVTSYGEIRWQKFLWQEKNFTNTQDIMRKR